MKPEILMVGPMLPSVMDELAAGFVVHRLWEAPDRAALLAAVADRVRGIATTGGQGADAALIDALPKLEIIACYGVGIDAIDLDRARARGVAVTNTPDVLTDDVADLAIGLLLAVVRRICEGDRFVRSGRWPREGSPGLGRRIAGLRLGIVGLGRIGAAVARRAEAFGVAVCYHNRREQAGQPYRCYPVLTEMARDCDVLVVTCAGGAATRHLVDRAVLAALGPEGVLINVARGSVVDEAALVAALTTGALGGAGLDVFADEPHVPEALFALESVVLQPHQGSATGETRAAMGRLVIDNLRAHFAGRPLLTPVT